MIAALVTGVLFLAPEIRTSKAGNPFVSVTLRIKDGEGSQFVRCTAFSDTAKAELLRLQDGETLSVQGPLQASIYTADDGNSKISLSIIANNVLALRATPKEWKATEERPRQERLAGAWTAASGDPNDDIGFGGEP